MNKRLILPILLVLVIIMAIVLLASYKIHGNKFFLANLLSAIDSQNATSYSSASSTDSASSTPTLVDILQSLQGQVGVLTNQMIEVRSGLEINNLRAIFTRTIKRGDSGNDVNKLQELLVKLGYYSTSTITGFYGPITEEAILKFQDNEGLDETGFFDEKTKSRLLELAAKLIAEETVPGFAPIDLSSVKDLQIEAEASSTQDSLVIQPSSTIQTASSASFSLLDLQNEISQLQSSSSNSQDIINDLQNHVVQLSSNMASLQMTIASMAYAPSNSVSAPSPSPAPVTTTQQLAISNIAVNNITKSSSTITWTTNNLSTSEVDYSQNSNMSPIQTVSSSTMAISHSLNLLNLNPGTNYYYRVISKDSAGGTASSTQSSFKTSS